MGAGASTGQFSAEGILSESEIDPNEPVENEGYDSDLAADHERLIATKKTPSAGIPTLDPRKGRLSLQPCLLYTSPSPRDATLSRMPSSA